MATKKQDESTVETPIFVTATQKWVKKRIEEVKSLMLDIKSSLVEMIVSLRNTHVKDMQTIAAKFSEMADHTITGKLTVEGDSTVAGSMNVSGPLTATGITSAAPIECTDPAGIRIITPGRDPVGLNPTELSLMNERGKIARFFMLGDKLCYNYAYDMIYVYFNRELGSRLQYLKRGGKRLAQIVYDIGQLQNDSAKEHELMHYFNIPPGQNEHIPMRLFGTTVNELYPALGTPFMIPESLLFTVPETYSIDSIKVLDSTGQAIKILKNFAGTNIKRLLVNFPYIPATVEQPAVSGIPMPVGRDETADSFVSDSSTIGMSTGSVHIQHVNDYEHAYYEITDSDAMPLFHETIDTGLIPNVIVRLSDFPKDVPSVLYFNVVNAH